MLTENQSPPRNPHKNPLLYSALAILLVVIYVGWVLVSRKVENRAYEQRLKNQRSVQQREADRATIEQLGESELSIQMLYATPQVHPGEAAEVCFGVANAKSVTLEPQANPVWPSHNLCVHVKPVKTTVYTLTATGADGKSVTQQVRVVVH